MTLFPDPEEGFLPPYTRALWILALIIDQFPSLGTIHVDVFDSGNSSIGSETVSLNQNWPDYPMLSWATIIGPTNDPIGHVLFTSLGATISVDLSHSSVVLGNDFILPGIPLPATLPLFATGLGVLGLLGWRRKRKAPAQFKF